MTISSKLLLLGSAAAIVGFSAQSHAFSNAHGVDFKKARATHGAIVEVAADSQNQDAEKFVRNMASDAIAFLGDAGLSKAEKEKRFSTLLNKSFDMNTIGRFALGRYWRVASADQRKEYQKLFREMIVDVYSARFGEYEGQSLEVRGSRQDNEKDVTVTSFIVPDVGQEIQVDWRVRQKKGQYKVIDVMVEGVSMALTQRSDFSSVIQRGGGEVGVLLEHLRAQ